ncbi:MAG: alpha-amylase/4-alpha-glucanotransferase domain-containing protein [bacterium]
MHKLNLHFTIHCHQPVGNFDGVFREAFEKSYKPFIKTIIRHPAIKFGLHLSGPVWDWVIANEPEFLSDIEKLIGRNQVELISGGYYEPILEILPENDAMGQVELMNKFIRTRFKQNPRGLWLAERVWDPSLPVLLSKLGIKYTTVDDTHFYYAGLEEKDIHGYYITERAGHWMNIFPIQKLLRYSIPFKEPSNVVEILKRYMDRENVNSVTYADDGEKFGLWPGTYKWVFEQGWLERFFIELENNANWLELTTQGEEIATNPPTGRIYLPSASYEELLEWALPSESAIKFRLFKASLSSIGIEQCCNPFIRGGFWDNFLVKYPESNWMHKRMLYISNMLTTVEDRIGFSIDDARLELFKSQSNCVYWHGLFGGVYLNYLRHAVYEHLLKAESIIEHHKPQSYKVSYVSQDIDIDGRNELILKNNRLAIYVAPSKGGAVVEIDERDHNFNVTNVIARRKEAYHDLILEKHKQNTPSDKPVTIHNLVNLKQPDLDKILIYDWHSRYSFVEHFLPAHVLEIDRLYRNQYIDLGDFTLEPYELVKQEGNTVFLMRDGHLFYDSKRIPFRIEKTYRLMEKRLETGYRITNTSTQHVNIALLIELNLTLLGTDDSRSVVFNGIDWKETKGMADFVKYEKISGFTLMDKWQKLGVKVSTSLLSTLFAYPLETVSASEDGFEKTYQGTCFLFTYQLDLSANESKGITIPVDFYDI